jgi:hypothetical protein
VTITLVQIIALLILLPNLYLSMVSEDLLQAIFHLLWVLAMVVVIVQENILMAIYGDEDDDNDQG